MAIIPGGPGGGGPQLAGLLGAQRPRPGMARGMPGGGPGGPGGMPGPGGPMGPGGPGGGMPPGGPGGGMPQQGQMPGPPEVGQAPPPDLMRLQQLLGRGGPGGPGAQRARPGSPDRAFDLNDQEEAALNMALGEPRARQELAKMAKKLLGMDTPEDEEDDEELEPMPGPSGRRDAERRVGAINSMGTGFDTDDY